MHTRHGTFANTPVDPFDVPDSDEEDIDDVNDQVIDQIGDQGGGQGIDPGGDQDGDQGIDPGDQVVNETGNNRILNVHDNAVPTKQQGGPFTKYDSGLLQESEEQRRLMWKMCKKYATKIIMCQLNKLINVVLTEANEFGKIGATERRAILVQAYRNREERMKLL
ncbi:hypothetical protein LXL04_007450 [Taraxacum kok-saghyz]